MRNQVQQLDGKIREATVDEAHSLAIWEDHARHQAWLRAWRDYLELPHGITTDFSHLRPAGPKPSYRDLYEEEEN